MSDSDQALTQAMLDCVPSDGSTIGNQTLLALLQARLPGLTAEAYQGARDALIADGVLAKGRGRLCLSC
jgi:hypothetical protein